MTWYEENMKLRCCYCGTTFEVCGSSDMPFGMEQIECPVCHLRGHRVRKCRVRVRSEDNGTGGDGNGQTQS
jgi:rRNA maturation endonuclease Nob1